MSELSATNCGCGCDNGNGMSSCLWIILLLCCCGGCGGNGFGGGFGGQRQLSVDHPSALLLRRFQWKQQLRMRMLIGQICIQPLLTAFRMHGISVHPVF